MSETLQMEATATDFDFLLGSWNVANRMLRRRLAGSDDWEEFAATAVVRPILDGLGNEDVFRTEHDGGFVGVHLLSVRLHARDDGCVRGDRRTRPAR